MKIRITHPDTVHDVGDEVDVSDDRAERLVNIGYAEYVDAPSDDTPDAPAQSAVKADWVDHAVGAGADRDEAEAMTKAELIERFG